VFVLIKREGGGAWNWNPEINESSVRNCEIPFPSFVPKHTSGGRGVIFLLFFTAKQTWDRRLDWQLLANLSTDKSHGKS